MLRELTLTLCLESQKEQIFRQLKLQGSTEEGAERARRLWPELKKLAEHLIGLRCFYCSAPNHWHWPEPILEDCRQLLFCCISLGPELEAQVQRFFEEKETLRAFFLDHLGSAALFAAGSAAAESLAGIAAKNGQALTPAFAPGEGRLPLELQKRIWEQLTAAGSLPVRLNRHYVLQPEKTLLSLFGLRPLPAGCLPPSLPAASPFRHDCSRCLKTDCYFRQEKTK